MRAFVTSRGRDPRTRDEGDAEPATTDRSVEVIVPVHRPTGAREHSRAPVHVRTAVLHLGAAEPSGADAVARSVHGGVVRT